MFYDIIMYFKTDICVAYLRYVVYKMAGIFYGVLPSCKNAYNTKLTLNMRTYLWMFLPNNTRHYMIH